MKWIKANLTLVITMAVGVLGVTALALGIVLSDTAQTMQDDQAAISSLSTLRPANARMIEEARKERDAVAARFQKTQEELKKYGNHEPLLPDVFPKVDPRASTVAYAFKMKFRDKQRELLKRLKADDQPSKEDIDREAENLADAKAKREREQITGTDPSPRSPRALSPQRRLQPGAAVARPAEALTPEERAKQDPTVRASILRAYSIYCYATPESLNPPANMGDTSRPSTLEEMWAAQVMVWIQEDVLGALAKVNDEAAAKLPEQQRWVGHLPVKHLFDLWIGGYVPASTGQGGGAAVVDRSAGANSGPPPGNAAAVFTNRGTTDGQIDVIQFALDLIVEAQSLPKVIDAICSAGFYTPLRVTYEAVSPVGNLEGYIYGPAPVIRVRLEYEGCFLRKKYEKWMPETVAAAIRENRGAELFKDSAGGATPQPRGLLPGGN